MHTQCCELSQVLSISSIRNIPLVGLLSVPEEQKSREQKGKQAICSWLLFDCFLSIIKGQTNISVLLDSRQQKGES